jgi:sulfite reductase alpha subunit
MGVLEFTIGIVLAYISVIVLVIGIIYKFYTWMRVPVPLKVPLTPGPTTYAGVAAKAGVDIKAITERCPTRCMEWDGKELKINNEDCTRCMYCINKMPKALRPGKERGATILLGGKATILQSAMLGWVIVPFMKIEKPYTELIDLIKRIVNWWDENARTRERVAELIYRVGMRVFLKAVGLPAVPQMVFRPRNNPYYFWAPEELEEVK